MPNKPIPLTSVRHPPGLTPKIIIIHTTPQQDDAMNHAINVRLQNPGKYNLYGRNCTAFVEDVLRAGGLNPIDTIFPLNLTDSLTPHPSPPPKQPVPCGGFSCVDNR